jgi:soluble lytic murein transglycosylase-like protein
MLFVLTASGLETLAHDRELATSLRCASLFSYHERKNHIPKDALYSISLQETGKIHSTKKIKIVWPWTVNVDGAGYFFNSKKEAIDFVKREFAKGASSVDIGCMQVNLKHHPDAFKSLDEAFEPRANIAYGAKFLRSKYEQLGSWHKAIAHYHSATEHLGAKYRDSVIRIASNIDKYKDPFKKYSKNYRSSKNNNNISADKNERRVAANKYRLEQRKRSRMMVHIPRQKVYYR